MSVTAGKEMLSSRDRLHPVNQLHFFLHHRTIAMGVITNVDFPVQKRNMNTPSLEGKGWSLLLLQHFFNDCIMSAHCYESILALPPVYTSYFCGFAPVCFSDPTSAKSLRLAMRHLDSYFFIGLTESYNDTLMLFRHLLPTFFMTTDQYFWEKARAEFGKERWGFCSFTRLQHSPEVALYDAAVERFTQQLLCQSIYHGFVKDFSSSVSQELSLRSHCHSVWRSKGLQSCSWKALKI